MVKDEERKKENGKKYGQANIVKIDLRFTIPQANQTKPFRTREKHVIYRSP